MNFPLAYRLRSFLLVLTSTLLMPVPAAPMDPEIKPIRKTSNLVALSVWIGHMDAIEGGVPIQVQVENGAQRDLCFDQIQVRGVAEGKIRFAFTMYRGADGKVETTPESTGDLQTVDPPLFWKLAHGAGMKFPENVIKNMGWIGARRRDISIILEFARASTRVKSCEAPPPHAFDFTPDPIPVAPR